MCADLMSIMLWMTPAGTLDEGGVPQPAYLNFRQRLLHEPSDADSFKARTRCSAASCCFEFSRRDLPRKCAGSTASNEAHWYVCLKCALSGALCCG